MPPKTSSTRSALTFFALSGAGLGLLLFLLETALVLKANAAGIQVELQGVVASLVASIRLPLASLLLRIVAAYVVAGAFIGFAAGLLVSGLKISGRRGWLVWFLECFSLAVLWAWPVAIDRPALFDDLSFFRPVLRWLVQQGQPWHAQLGVGVFAIVNAFFLWNRRSAKAAQSAVRASWVLACLFVVDARLPTLARGPLVVLIGIDAFRPDRLRALGGKGDVAPNVEAFLGDATLFSSAYTPIAQTEPAWRSLLTARWPSQTNVRYPLTPSWREIPSRTFAQAFGSGGFSTSFATDCSRFNHLGPSAGFQSLEQPPAGALNFVLEKLRYRALGVFADNALGVYGLPEVVNNRALAGVYNPRRFASDLSQSWVQAARRGPAFVSYHATSAHFPGDPVFPFYRRNVPPAEIFSHGLRMSFAPLSTEAVEAKPNRQLSEGLYDELLAEADEQVGVLLSALKREGLYDEATVVLFSDHGESFYADLPQFWGSTPVHGARLSEDENRILLAVKLPKSHSGGAQPKTVDALVRLIDIGPTLLEMMGLPPLAHADGKSILPLLRNRSMPSLRLYAETGFTHASPELLDPGHRKGPPRTFEAYHVRTDGLIELDQRFHQAALREKDRGAFDGKTWVILSPREDGSVIERCAGLCPNPALSSWLHWTLEPPSRF